MKPRAAFSYTRNPEEKYIFIEDNYTDMEPTMTVTNDAEAVIEEIKNDLMVVGQDIRNYAVMCRDTEGDIDEFIINKDGDFGGFLSLGGAQDFETAKKTLLKRHNTSKS